MNVGDILHFKPEFKRGAPDEDEEGAAAVPAAKVRRKLQEIERSRKDLPFDQLTDEEKLKMLQAAESEVIGGGESFVGFKKKRFMRINWAFLCGRLTLRHCVEKYRRSPV